MAKNKAPIPFDLSPQKKGTIRKRITRWFGQNGRDLPWRTRRTPYRVWISEIMAQQTRIETVIPYFNRFVERFPDIKSLCEASEDEVLALWAGLGYYGRGRNLHAAAKQIVQRFQGKIPADPKALQSLPGIGRYSAGAIASIAFNIPTPILDGNVIRVLTRLFDIDNDTALTDTKNELWALAEELVPPKKPGAFNEGQMELGALVCTPTSPACDKCPVATLCLSKKQGTILERPVKTPKKPPKAVRLQAGIIRNNEGGILLIKNSNPGLYGNMWRLPWDPPDAGSSSNIPPEKLGEVFSKQIEIQVKYKKALGQVEHVLTHRKLIVSLHEFSTTAKLNIRKPPMEIIWISREDDLHRLALPTLIRKIFRQTGLFNLS